MGLDAAIAKASGEEYGFKDAVKSFAGGFVAGLIGAGVVSKAKKGVKLVGNLFRRVKPGDVSSLYKTATLRKVGKSPGEKGATIYGKSGGFKQANKEFDKLTKGLEVNTIWKDGKKIRTATLKSGEKINVRNFSTESSPTLEIISGSKKAKEVTKIRYE